MPSTASSSAYIKLQDKTSQASLVTNMCKNHSSRFQVCAPQYQLRETASALTPCSNTPMNDWSTPRTIPPQVKTYWWHKMSLKHVNIAFFYMKSNIYRKLKFQWDNFRNTSCFWRIVVQQVKLLPATVACQIATGLSAGCSAPCKYTCEGRYRQAPATHKGDCGPAYHCGNLGS